MTDTKTLYAAMAKAFASMEGANKDTVNPHFKVRYADLASVVSAIKPALTENDLWFRQYTHEQSGGVCVETMVCHASGEELSFGKLFVPASKQDAQGYGSALTYARRYSLMTAFGICPEDDDGNSAKPAPKQSDGPALISDEQRNELTTLIAKLGHDIGAVCQDIGIKSLKNIRAESFEKAKAKINDFQSKKEQ
jgi:ERF superfamily